MICKFSGYDPNDIKYDTTKYVGAKSKRLEVKRLYELLPEFRQLSLEEGLSSLVGEYMANEGAPAHAAP
jgi:GDP-L-fucose synthase